MTNFFQQLIARNTQPSTEIQPRLQGRFEPVVPTLANDNFADDVGTTDMIESPDVSMADAHQLDSRPQPLAPLHANTPDVHKTPASETQVNVVETQVVAPADPTQNEIGETHVTQTSNSHTFDSLSSRLNAVESQINQSQAPIIDDALPGVDPIPSQIVNVNNLIDRSNHSQTNLHSTTEIVHENPTEPHFQLPATPQMSADLDAKLAAKEIQSIEITKTLPIETVIQHADTDGKNPLPIPTPLSVVPQKPTVSPANSPSQPRPRGPVVQPAPATPPVPKMPAAPKEEHTVNVTIGRIEVRTASEAAPTAPPKKPRPQQTIMSLDDYLQKRSGGGR